MSAPSSTPVPAPRSTTVATERREACTACGRRMLEQVLDLPQLPLTGIFVPPLQRNAFPTFDQALLHCQACGHAQLREVVDPRYLYQETYTHRSSLSPISRRGNDFFLAFLQEVIGERTFDCIAEIGCNDLYLLQRLVNRGRRVVGFDPIWKDEQPAATGGVDVAGKYIEEILPGDFGGHPDLVLSVHTLEHVRDPRASLQPIFDYARPGALFAIELPSFDTLLDTGRFDQIFHQHLNYFSLASVRAMIEALGGEFIRHRYNYGYWLGTLLVAFRKPDTAARSKAPDASRQRPAAEVAHGYGSYRAGMEAFAESLVRLKREGVSLVGFGAAQMVPTLAYHLRSDLSMLDAILDDNAGKNRLVYPGLAPEIRLASDWDSLAGSGVLITALDSARPIMRKLVSLEPRYILHPGNPF